MRKNGKHLDSYRKIHPRMGSSPFGSLWGYFRVRCDQVVLGIISSGGQHGTDGVEAWEHVSVSIFPGGKRLPSWEEMCVVKDLFWEPEETVVQFHPPRSVYVNLAPVLHLWKPPYEVALPPTIALGPIDNQGVVA